MVRSQLQSNLADQLGITDVDIRTFLSETRRRHRPNTQYNYAMALEYAKRNVRNPDLLNWKPADIRDFIDWMEQNGCKVSTIKNRIAALSAFFNYYVRIDRLTVNPVTKVDLPRPRRGHQKPVFLNMDEVRQLLAYQQTTYDQNGREEKDLRGIMVRSFLLTLIFTGVRVAKLCSLMLYDFSGLETPQPTLEIMDAKGGKDRTIPLHPAVISAYQDWKAIRPQSPSTACYINLRTQQPLNPRTIQRHVRNLTERSGIGKEITPHKLRHTFATLLMKDGKADIKDIQELLGHESPVTTMIYLHSDQETKQKVIHGLLLDNDSPPRT
jgi:site-specific recombinase XerD